MIFKCKQFEVRHGNCAHRVGEDSIVLGSWVDLQDRRRVLDVGTGSGLLALMCAQKNQEALVSAIEIHAPSVDEAKLNFESSPWSDKLDVVQQDLNSFTAGPYDFIISNPPFYTEDTMSPDTSRSNARSLETESLMAWIAKCGELLTKDGQLALILPISTWSEIGDTVKELGFFVSRQLNITAKEGKLPHRVCLQLSLAESKEVNVQSLFARLASGEYSSEFRALTSAFYL